MHHRDARSRRGASLTAAFAGKPKTDPPCSISPSPAAVGETYVVSVSGLPTGVPINLWITDPSGSTSGYPLASTGDGSFALSEGRKLSRQSEIQLLRPDEEQSQRDGGLFELLGRGVLTQPRGWSIGAAADRPPLLAGPPLARVV
jgi:hypothetical protein